MIIGSRHVGLVVGDLERSLRFYRDCLGFKLIKTMVEEGSYIDNVVGIPGCRLEWAKLTMPDGSIFEIIQYHQPIDMEGSLFAANRQAFAHLALTVRDAEATCDLIQSSGGTCHGRPQLSPDGLVKVVYCRDPDGFILEIVEEIGEKT